MTFARHLTACLMMVLLVLTGQQITMAKASAGGTEMVICVGGGLVTLTLDAEGNPTGPAHVCPDAMLAFVPDIALPVPAPRRISSHLATVTVPAIPAPWGATRLLPPPRGPPLPV